MNKEWHRTHRMPNDAPFNPGGDQATENWLSENQE
jgi:hypothetical protein